MQIKTMMRYHYTPIQMTKIRNNYNTKCWQDFRILKPHTLGMNNGTATLEKAGHFKTKMQLLYNPAVTLYY